MRPGNQVIMHQGFVHALLPMEKDAVMASSTVVLGEQAPSLTEETVIHNGYYSIIRANG
jgi:hypothetical protein